MKLVSRYRLIGAFYFGKRKQNISLSWKTIKVMFYNLSCSTLQFLDFGIELWNQTLYEISEMFHWMMIFFQMHFYSSKTSNALLNSWKLSFQIVSAFVASSINKNSIEFADFHGSFVNGAQNVHFVLNLNFPTTQHCFQRVLWCRNL